LIPPDAQIEKLCEGFNWSEGPVWKDGAVLFSDVPENVVYQWKPGETKAAVFLKPSGLLKPTPGFREQGSNGLALDAEGRLILCQHGERRVARLNADGTQTALADKFEGKRFNSPNDLAFRKNGDIHFTDPPYGLEKLNDSPLKEIPFNGVYRRTPDGKVTLLTREIGFPNGIAFSPDEKTLYVADSKELKIFAFDVQPDGATTKQRVLFDAMPLRKPDRKGSCDGMKVDKDGNLWATGPGGVLILTPAGKHLGTILTGEATANCAWGDGGSTLYMTADMFLCRIRTATKGAGY
ncbi:MAG: SMP-30/gluconolactonase/LRE family protein, partial [Pseudomonadota bacterium]|nr:SMP-30/gluconolactonase/LRE family protein [Pseudomonadota bacterium]